MNVESTPVEGNEEKVPDNTVIQCYLQEEPIKLQNKKGEVKEYVLREMLSIERDKYMQLHSKRWKDDQLINVVQMKSELICRCLYNMQDQLVAQNIIDAFPPSVQDVLWQKCRVLNGMTPKAEEDAKKD